jgi:hypothetical protein
MPQIKSIKIYLIEKRPTKITYMHPHFSLSPAPDSIPATQILYFVILNISMYSLAW